MADRGERICFGLAGAEDRRLFGGYLAELGYKPLEITEGNIPEGDLYLLDKSWARRIGREALARKRTDRFYLPLLVALHAGEDSAPWLAAGFDDCLRLPVPKGDLKARLAILLHVRRQSRQIAAQAEAALQKSEERYRTYIEEASDYIFTVDPDGKIATANRAMCRALGYSEDELKGMAALDLVLPEARRIAAEALERVAKGERVPAVEIPVVTRRGEQAYVQIRSRAFFREGKLAETLHIARDVTEQRLAEQERQASEERYRTLVEASPDAIVLLDPERNILACNEALTRMTGYSREEVIGKSARIFYRSDEEFRSFGQRVYGEVQKRGFFRTEWEPLNREGKPLVTEAIVSAVRRPDGIVSGYVAIARDISERKRLEAEFLQAQKMEAVGRLAGGVAHDFNNLLTVVQGYAEMALRRLEPSDPLTRDLNQILTAASRSADLARQLLAFARKETASPQPLVLNDSVAGMLNMLRRLIGEDVELQWRPGKDPWPVKIDPAQVDQILANLIVNARDALAGPGKITVETANVVLADEAAVRHADFQPGPFVMLAVSDTGSGMDQETLARIFEPFFTTKEHGRGTGLGLATVYGIVKQNGGFIHVYSEPGQGSTFRIYLPRCEPAGAVRGKAVRTGPKRTGSETVLLVEDETPLLELATRLFKNLGYTVLAASSPSHAIEVARQHTGEIHLLMTDVVMPEMNGHRLWQELVALRPGLKCLFVSGYTADVIAHHGVLDEGVHFLPKPFTLETLAIKVREAIEG
jgi:two-component system cell cycle sensor histidine kinase/response regulator CckA